MKPKDQHQNDKDNRWKPPVDLPNVKPAHYPMDIDSGNGSAAHNAGKRKADSGPPDYTLPGFRSS